MLTESKLEPAGFEARELRHHATTLRYLVGGSGPPLVLVHGLGGAPSNWRLVAPALAAERRVIVPALPGHGGSGRLPAAPTLDPYAEAVLAVLEHEDALPAPWVGHSLGGIIGLRAAVRRPEAVTGLVLERVSREALLGPSAGTAVDEWLYEVAWPAQPRAAAALAADFLSGAHELAELTATVTAASIIMTAF